MSEEELNLIDDDITTEDLERVRLYAEINLLRLKAEEATGRMEQVKSTQYGSRVIHLADFIDVASTKRVITQLAEMVRQGDEPIEIIFHSPGGDVFSGNALFDYIQMVRAMGIHVTTACLGGAFSMAGLLLQAGDTRVMSPNSWMMIHEVGSGVYGKLNEVRDQADLLERIEVQGTKILAERSTLSVDEIRERCRRKDWWLNAEEALAYGFIDEIRPLPEVVEEVRPVKRARKSRKAAA